MAAPFLEAFGTKLAPSLGTGDQAQEFIARGLRPDFAFTAVAEDGTLPGAAGTKTEKGGLLTAHFSDLLVIYGPSQAIWHGVVHDQLVTSLWAGPLELDGIFVAEGARGLGVGTALLDAVVWTARMNRCGLVRLDVVNDNPRARALYERYGFREVGTLKAGLLAPLLGFKEAATMVFDVN